MKYTNNQKKRYFKSINTEKISLSKEINFGITLQKTLTNLPIIPQYPVLGYRIDFYLPTLKLAIEYDEKHHKAQIKQDNERQTKIEKFLGCTFIRVQENHEAEGLNQIIDFCSRKKE